MKFKIASVTLISAVSILALAGCQPATPAATTTTTTTTGTTTSTGTTASTGGDIATPSDAKDLNNVSAAGNKVVTYNTSAAVDAACTAQAKMITDAGWKASANTPSPISAGGAWTQTFESGKMMTVLACTASPTATGSSMVTMTTAANPMAS